MSVLNKLIRVLVLIPMFIGYFFVVPSAAATTNLLYGTANEGWDLTMTAPDGAVFTDVYFASYGTPDQYTLGWCHSDVSIQKVAEAFIGKQTATLNANNGVFGDPCVGIYKHLDVVLTYEYVVPQPILNAPRNLEVFMVDGMVRVKWSAPLDSGTPVERYAVMWSIEGNAGWAVASTDTLIDLSLDVFRSNFPLDTLVKFSVRADNDTLAVYSEPSTPVEFFIAEPPLPQYPCWDGSTVSDLSQCPPIPPSVECWDGTFVYDISECPVKPVIPEPTPEPKPEPQPEPQPVDPVPPVTPPTPEEPKQEEDASNVADDAASDGVITEEEKEEIVNALLEDYSTDEAIPAGMIEELGLDYEDLPPDQPVTLENGVVLIAEVADAIEIFENPAELLSTVFTDPSKALMAVANVGADLPAAVREEAQKVTVAAVIVSQVVSGTASLLTRRI